MVGSKEQKWGGGQSMRGRTLASRPRPVAPRVLNVQTSSAPLSRISCSPLSCSFRLGLTGFLVFYPQWRRRLINLASSVICNKTTCYTFKDRHSPPTGSQSMQATVCGPKGCFGEVGGVVIGLMGYRYVENASNLYDGLNLLSLPQGSLPGFLHYCANARGFPPANPHQFYPRLDDRWCSWPTGNHRHARPRLAIFPTVFRPRHAIPAGPECTKKIFRSAIY